MKRTLWLLTLILTLVYALSSCNVPFLQGQETSATTSQETIPEEITPEETTPEETTPEETTPEETTPEETTPEETTPEETTPEETVSEETTPDETTPEETTPEETVPEETTPEEPATEGIIYRVSADGTYAEVVKYSGKATQVRIAAAYQGVPVTRICEEAFRGCTDLESITIGDHITSIGDSAFYNCYYLTSVVIGNGVTNIGNSAFYNCFSLASVVIGNSVTNIGSKAFYNCDALENITIPDNVKNIESTAFSSCHPDLYTQYQYGKYIGDTNNPYAVLISVSNHNVAAYDIHRDTKIIACGVFKDCSGLTSITIPDGVRHISNEAFYNCEALKGIVISNSVTSIGNSAFYNCGLNSLIIGNSVTSIGDSAFAGCYSLKNVYFKGSVEQWGAIKKDNWCSDLVNYSCYIYCTDGEVTTDGTVTYHKNASEGLQFTLNDDGESYSVTGIGTCTDTDVVIPHTYNNLPVTSIGGSAFGGCCSFYSIFIPNSVTSIGDYAFNCSSLMSIVIPDSVTSIGMYAFQTCYSLTSVVIGDGVTSIGDCAFASCYTLTNVTLGDNVTSIGQAAFTGVPLASIAIPSSVTSIGYQAFYACTSLTNAIFINPNGWWYASSTDATSGTDISTDDLSDSFTAAQYLRKTYNYYYWFRTE